MKTITRYSIEYPVSTLALPQWHCDSFELSLVVLNEEERPVWVSISQRQLYCDRGHYMLKCNEGIPSLDHMDMFPRYYMDLDIAKSEAVNWLKWRIHRQPNDHRSQQQFAESGDTR